MIDRIAAMARGAPEQQNELSMLALQSLEDWRQIAGPETPIAEAKEYVSEARAGIEALRDQRISMVGKPISLAERNPDDPAEIETWRLHDKAFQPVNRLCDCLVGFTKERELQLRKMVEEQRRQRLEEDKCKTKTGFWSKLIFWRR